jgi:hypothetical protein
MNSMLDNDMLTETDIVLDHGIREKVFVDLDRWSYHLETNVCPRYVRSLVIHKRDDEEKQRKTKMNNLDVFIVFNNDLLIVRAQHCHERIQL